ncbi:MAG: aminotransferase class I/II-fold pyridoxal phosphate-dependent enzyme [Alphaproteobacteria bacterium]|nr:aminotransferase class I/II-fold pyridoxal phosphate-dependent enzyme [Alphaproteobacteria bacterium]
MLNPRLETLLDSPFRRIDRLLEPIKPPSGLKPVILTVGEPQHPQPDLLAKVLRENEHDYGTYPPIPGTPEFRRAVADWLTRRYALPAGMIEPDRHIVPVSGTREGLFLLAPAVVPETKGGGKPLVLMPNPFYQAYIGAAVAAGAEPHYVAARAETDFLPDLASIGPANLARAALAYVCTPTNPQSTVGDLDWLKRVILLAREHDFVVAIDECYAEIYDRAPPPGGLEACAQLGGSMKNVIVFHSLSKRSSVPGLRSGFAAGDPEVIARYTRLRFYSVAGMPMPVFAASTALWREESHVEANRAIYRRKFDMAQRAIGNRFGFRRPAGGFYLWLDVGDGERVAKELWGKAAIKVLPGGYMARDVPGEVNPGKQYIRIALVADERATQEAMQRLAEAL